MAATCTACAACCSLCCCGIKQLCGLCGYSFRDLVEDPAPSTSTVAVFLTNLRSQADPDGERDVICCCLPKAIVCCLPRLCCSSVFRKPDPVPTVRSNAVLEAAQLASNKGPSSFLANERAVRYTTDLFKSKDGRSECRLEYMSAGMILLSIGSIKDKLKALFETFQHSLGGIFDKDALKRVLRSILKTVLDLAEKIVDYVNGVLPGGKSVKLMLTALNGTIGSYFIENKVHKMLTQNDTDQSGSIDYPEFERAALTRDSLVRKAIRYVERKTAVMRGESKNETVGEIQINGETVYARVEETNIEAEQCLEYWPSAAQVGQRSSRLGRISFQEPCAISDGESEDDLIFNVIDKDGKEWKIECSDQESFFDWFDAVDDKCDAKLEDDDLDHDGPIDTLCPSTLSRILS